MSAHTCKDCQVSWVALGPDQYEIRGITFCSLHTAAPALLEALEAIMSYEEALIGGHVPVTHRDNARAALALARGGEHG